MNTKLANLNTLGKEINSTQEIIMSAFETHIDHINTGRLIAEVPDTAALNKMYARRIEMVNELNAMGVDTEQVMAAARGKLND